MHAFEALFILLFVVVAAFQVWLTFRVFRSSIYERKQKIWQAQLIWLLPVIGAGVVFSVLRDSERAEKDASHYKT